MISQHAQAGFEHVFKQGLQSSLAPGADDRCDITEVPNTDEASSVQVVMLTISSFLFRLIVLIHFSSNEATREHFARINGKQLDQMDDQGFQDAIRESGNICCGALNRDLLPHFPHMGLSTPNILHRNSADHLEALKYGFIKHVRVVVNDAVTFYATLCVCESGALDFEVDVNAQEVTGELELF